jgi:hypothetical protein
MHAAFRPFGVALLLSSTVVAFAASAAAQDAGGATADDRKQAAADFAEGDRAFKDGDFRRAAEAYEHAYQRVPHHSTLWNSARAWHHAGELARAANLYARYLREAPANARDRNSAQSALTELAGKLARLEIHATDVSSVQVDGQPLDAPSLFVTPGAHVVEGRTRDDRAVRQEPTVAAGDVVSIALVAPAAPSRGTPPPPPPPPPPPGPTVDRRSHGWPPAVVYVGGAATVVLAGFTVWSGLDTVQQKNSFVQSPSQSSLDSGRSKEVRTNVLIGATAGVAALTALTAVVLVDWHGSSSHEKNAEPRVELGAGVGSLLLWGQF